MSKHTPGPWVKDGIEWFGSNGEKVVISYGPAYGSKIHFRNAEANSRLITAAPDLLEALTKCVEIMSYGGTWTLEDQHTARAAIAKATGEQQ